MWEPRPLTTLWASTVYHKDSVFTSKNQGKDDSGHRDDRTIFTKWPTDAEETNLSLVLLPYNTK
jgi:hypothetical protein